MSRITVKLDEAGNESKAAPQNENAPHFGEYRQSKRRGIFVKILRVLGILFAVAAIIGATGGYFYWQNLKKTPQYSLALLIDAARRDDQKAIDELVDTDQIVEDFVPQITGKAIELYGRNLPPQTLFKVAQAAAPLMPAVKERARAEIPNLIREKTKKFENVPFWAIAVGADRYLNITQETEKAFVSSKLQDRPLELALKRNGEKWQVVAVKDEELARRIADKIGQELILLAQKGSLKKAGESLGVGNLNEMLKQFDGIFK